MADGGCGSCAQGFLIVFNVLFLCLGLVPLVFGIIALVDQDTFDQILWAIPGSAAAEDLIRNSAAYLVVLGVIVFTIGLIGSFNACYRAKAFLYLYLLLLLLLLATEITLIILALAYPNTLSSTGQSVMKKTISGLQDCEASIENKTVSCPTSSMTSLAWHTMQFELRCCGAKDYTDYADDAVEWERRAAGAKAPLTCCMLTITEPDFPPLSTSESPTCYQSGLFENQYVAKGCFDVVYQLIVTSPMIIGIASSIVGLQVILILSTVVLLCDNSKSRVGHHDDDDDTNDDISYVTNQYHQRTTNHVHWADDYYYGY